MIKIIFEKCNRCGLCERACAFGGIKLIDKAPVITAYCNGCGYCVDVCECGAIGLDPAGAGGAGQPQPFKGLLVVGEQAPSDIHPVTLELLGSARRLADEKQVEVSVVLLGSNLGRSITALEEHGADRIFVADLDFLNPYRTAPFVRVLSSFIEQHRPEIILLGATAMGRDLAPRLANNLRAGLTADCTQLEIAPDSGRLIQTKPAYGEKLMASIMTSRFPQMLTIRPGVMQASRCRSEKTEVIALDVEKDVSDDVVSVLKISEKDRSGVAFDKADVIVAGGRGVGSMENFKLLEQLAEILSGQVGATRAAVEMGWIDHARQIGQTGQTVHPRLYIACGISGAVQHVAGIQNADMVVAINSDPEAPVFGIADIGLVGDVACILREIINLVKP